MSRLRGDRRTRVPGACGKATIGPEMFRGKIWICEAFKLSHSSAVFFSGWQRKSRSHSRLRTPPLHSGRQGFENAGACFWPVPLVSLSWAFFLVVYYRIAQISRLKWACARPLHVVCHGSKKGKRVQDILLTPFVSSSFSGRLFALGFRLVH